MGGTLIPFVVVVVTVSAILASGMLGPRLELPRSPEGVKTPNPEKAPWHFWGIQERLVGVHPFLIGTVIPTASLVGPPTMVWWLVAVLFLAPRPSARASPWRLRLIVAVSAILGLALAAPWLYVFYCEAFDPWRPAIRGDLLRF